jgi:SAM-dependent methyltransferase
MPPDGRFGPDDILPPRREGRHVAFPRASWTSFDRYDRYGAIARAVRATLGPGRHKVLDVGDSSGYLRAFDDDFDVVCVDVVASASPLPGLVLVVGDGAKLPFADAEFDAVITSDSLEHVVVDDRPAFVAELDRVSRELVVLGAPFDTPGVAGVEELVRRYSLLTSGSPQEQLEEHAENGLPGLDETVEVFRKRGLTVEQRGNGHLYDWLLMMLLKEQLGARPALGPLDAGYDVLYNFLLSSRAELPPYYRHVILASRSRALDFGAPPPGIAGAHDDIAPMLGALIAANVSEVIRQDNVPELHRIQHTQAEFGAQLSAIAARVEDLHQRIDQLVRPLKKVRDVVSPGRKSQPDRT